MCSMYGLCQKKTALPCSLKGLFFLPLRVPHSASQQPFWHEVLDLSFPRNNLNIMGVANHGNKASLVGFSHLQPHN